MTKRVKFLLCALLILGAWQIWGSAENYKGTCPRFGEKCSLLEYLYADVLLPYFQIGEIFWPLIALVFFAGLTQWLLKKNSAINSVKKS